MPNTLFDTSEPKTWVSLAFILLVGFSGKKIGKLLAGVLDARTAKIKSELDAAKALRVEAAEVLALYKQKQAEFTKEAEAILAKARADADRNTASAQAELKIALETRTKNAMERIAQEEVAAIAEVRNQIVEMAIAAARNIIAEQSTKTSPDALMKVVVADIEQKIY